MSGRTRHRAHIWPAHEASESWEKGFLQIGHGGASAHAKANSMESLEAAISMGVDVVEFDVRPCRDALILVHDERLPGPKTSARYVADCTLEDVRAAASDDLLPTLAEALDFVKGRALVNLDLKAGGCEAEVLEHLYDRGMLSDTLISSLLPASLLRIRGLARRALTGLSYPEDKGGASGNPRLKPVVDAVVAAMRYTLPYRVALMMARAQSNAVMLYHRVVSSATVNAVHGLGGKVFAWTVDDRDVLERVHAMGVDGVASNDPRIFDSLRRSKS